MTQPAVGYVRVSSEMQLEGHSLAAQRNEIARFCERERHERLRIYADEGVSAHTDLIEKCPQLAALLDDVATGAFDLVIVHTIDRWARNVGVQRQALQWLGAANVGFASVTESIDFSTPAGKLMLTMIGGVSEFFSDQLAVQVALRPARCRAATLSIRRAACRGSTRSPDPFSSRRLNAARRGRATLASPSG